MKERIAYFDFLRGLAIMMVVGIHTYTLGKDNIVVRQLLNTAVPLFIAISGYFLSQKKMENKDDYFSFLKKQLPKVYLPVLVWSLPLYALALFTDKNILLNTVLLLTCGISIYYFVAFIMQCYILLPAINYCMSNIKYQLGGVIICSLLSLVWITGMVYLNTIKSMSIPIILYAGPLPCWIMFFVLGVLIGRNPQRQYSIILPIILLIIGLVLSVIETNFLIEHYGKGVGIKPSTYLYSVGMIFLLFSNKVEKLLSRTGAIYRFITWIGSLSFGIYLIHCYFVSFIIKLIPINIWLMKWALVLVLTALMIVTMRKILPTKYYKYLGI